MCNRIRRTVDQTEAIHSVITIIPCYRHQTILLRIIADLLIEIGTAYRILTVYRRLIDRTKLSDHHRVSLRNKLIF